MDRRPLLLLAALLPVRAAAQEEVEQDFDLAAEPAGPAPAAQGFSGLETPAPKEHVWVVWQLRKQLLEQGKDALADKKVEELLQARVDHGLRNLSPLANGLLREAWDVAAKGQVDRAVALARVAETLAPDVPEPNLALARLHVTGRLQIGSALGEALKGLRKVFLHPLRVRRLVGEVVLRLLLAFLLTVGLFAVVLWVRYGRMLGHDIQDLLPAGASAAQAGVLLALAALAPLLLGLPVAATVVLWLVALFGYQRGTERLLSLLTVAALASLPWTLRGADRFLRHTGDVGEALFLANHDLADAATLRKLEDLVEGGKADAEVLFTAGLVDKREGRLYRAEERLKAAFEKSGRRLSAALVNLGNVYLAGNRLSEAAQAYDRAAELAPGLASVHFNRSKLYQARGDAEDKVSRALTTALALDEARVEAFQQHQVTSLNRYVLDETLSRGRILARLLQAPRGTETLGPFLWPLLAGGIRPGDAPMLGGIGLVLLVLMWLLQGRLRFASPCGRCGAPVCVRCSPGIGRTGNCTDCYDVFHRAERVQPRDRQRRELAVRAFKSRRRSSSMLLTLALTGAGHLLVGRPLRGAAFLVVFFLFVSSLVAWEGLLRPLSPAFPGFPTGQIAASGVVFVVFYLLAILDIRVEDR